MTAMWLNELQFTQEDSQYALRGLEIAGAYDATWTTLAFLMFFDAQGELISTVELQFTNLHNNYQSINYDSNTAIGSVPTTFLPF